MRVNELRVLHAIPPHPAEDSCDGNLKPRIVEISDDRVIQIHSNAETTGTFTLELEFISTWKKRNLSQNTKTNALIRRQTKFVK
jgi:hypothetical protein